MTANLPRAEARQDEGQLAYEAGHFETARSIWQLKAASGDADAALGLGLLYDLGQGVSRDDATAYGWYLLAASAGNSQAEFNVAVMNDNGRGIARNEAAAAEWYGRAAAHGLARAQYNLAQLYEAGEGLPRNPDAALAWYQAVAPTLPAAASRAAQIRAHRGLVAVGDTTLAQPSIPDQPIVAFAGKAAELVWSAPMQPSPVRYYVVLISLDSEPPRQVFSGFTDRTAMLVQAASILHAYAWKVCAVGRDTPHYTGSPWKIVGR